MTLVISIDQSQFGPRSIAFVNAEPITKDFSTSARTIGFGPWLVYFDMIFTIRHANMIH